MKATTTQPIFCCLLWYLVITLVGLLSVNQYAQAQTTVNSTDSLALVNLYAGSGGATWTDNSNWLLMPVATWQGVTLDGTGTRVIELDLSGNNLSGSISNLNLPELRSLSLANNNLSGQIPNFANLPLLQYLDLSGNAFTGAVPNFTNLPQLVVLQLSSNNLTSFPNFTNLPNLQIFSAEYNQLGNTANFPTFGSCPQLQILELSSNALTGTLPTFNLPQLTVLRLADNQLSGNLPSFAGTPNLQILVLTNNLLSGSIPALALSQLQELYLDYNDFSGTLPSFTTTPNLTALFLSGNNLSGTVPNFSAFANLLILYLDDNAFTFAGMEANAVHFNNIGGIMVYEPQAEIGITATSNTTLSVNAGGTMANNTYNWYIAGSNTLVASIVGNNNFTPTTSGAYYCVVTNSQATALTLYSTSATIIACSVGVSITNAACTGIANGALTAMPTGSTAYTYTWSNGATTATIINLAAGTYYLTVTGANACYATASATINYNSTPDFVLHQTTDSYCNAEHNYLTLPFIVETNTPDTYTITATTSLETVTVNIAANVNFDLNLSSATPADENIVITTSNSFGCRKDTIIVNDKCCRIMQEGALVAIGPSEKTICPNTPIILAGGCVLEYIITDSLGVVKQKLAPDNGQCVQSSTIVKYMTSKGLTAGKYRLYGHKKCAGGTPIVEGDLIDCPDPLHFYYKRASLLVRASTMNTILEAGNLLPLNNAFNSPPWNYAGTESIASQNDFSSNTVDWLLLELRDPINNATIVARKAALLLKNGTVVDVNADGTMSSLTGVHFITFSPENNYYLIVRHRNHLAVMSSVPLTLNGFGNYNFTIASNIAGGATQLYNSGGGLLSLRPGDTDANGIINVTDYNFISSQAALTNVYNDADTNLDGNITVADFNFWQPNASAIGIPLVRY